MPWGRVFFVPVRPAAAAPGMVAPLAGWYNDAAYRRESGAGMDAGAATVFSQLPALPAARLAGYLGREAPQTVAALLLPVPHGYAAEVLACLPEDLRGRVLRCMRTTRPAAPGILDDLGRVVRADLLDAPADAAVGDRSAEVARIVAALPPDLRDGAAAALLEPVPPMAARVAGRSPPEPVALPALPPGWAAMLDTTRLEYDRLPMLEVVLDRLVRMLATTARDLAGRTVAVTLERIRTVRFGDWVGEPAARPLFGVFHAAAWDNYGLLAPDRDLLDAIGEALLGGAPETAGLRTPDRPPTAIDRRMAGRMLDAVLADLGAAFDPICAVAFTLDRLEEDARFACVTRLHNACLVAELGVALDGRPGCLELVFPYATLEPVRDRLSRMFMGERFGNDPLWAGHIRTQLAQAHTGVRAVAGTADVSLGAMLAWRPGTVFVLDAAAEGTAALVIGGITVAHGLLGRRGTRWAVATEGMPIDPVPLPSAEATTPAPDPTPVHTVTVRVSAVIGQAWMTIEDVMRLGRGGIVELDRRVGELIGIHANGRLVARGVPVIVGDRFGISLSEVAGGDG